MEARALALSRGEQEYPDTLYQYRPDWLGRQSLDLYIPILRTAIEYQGIQHYLPVEFFGGEEALAQRQELDQSKRSCVENAGAADRMALQSGTHGPECPGADRVI